MKTIKILGLIASLMILTATSMAQDLTNLDLKGQMLADWERAKIYTLEYIDAMPEDGINFKPAPELRSFAEQFLHMSQGTIGLVVSGTGATPIFQGKTLEKMDELKNKEALTDIVMECYEFALKSIRDLDAARLNNMVKRGNFEVSQYGWLLKAFEHQTHHRAQTTIYLRLKGIKPPNERLF